MRPSYIVARLTCKGWELLLRAVTSIRRLGTGDPTNILLDEQTEAQRAALAARLAAVGTPPAGGSKGREHLAVVIPFRDQIALTRACVTSLLSQQRGTYDMELILVDNGSAAAETAGGLGELSAKAQAAGVPTRILRVDEPFNYSRLNNLAVATLAESAPRWLLFLNNDIEFRTPDDLGRLVAFARTCPALGVLGCTLLYPNGRLQHLFAAPGVKIVAAHPFRGARLNAKAAWFREARPVAAVTGAIMLLERSAFAAVGGFDERLPTVGQDIDLCLKLQRSGRVNWTLPGVTLIHREGASRGGSIDKTQVETMYAKWGDELRENRYYSPRFSRYSERPVYRLGEPSYPWRRVLR